MTAEHIPRIKFVIPFLPVQAVAFFHLFICFLLIFRSFLLDCKFLCITKIKIKKLCNMHSHLFARLQYKIVFNVRNKCNSSGFNLGIPDLPEAFGNQNRIGALPYFHCNR